MLSQGTGHQPDLSLVTSILLGWLRECLPGCLMVKSPFLYFLEASQCGILL